MLLHYIVIGAERTYDDEGNPCTPVFTHASGDGIPTYQSLGLLELAAHRLRRHDDGIELRQPDD